ncbi:MAG: hypothetical protein LYZ69_07395 [Nitrososphaerales archaeon]|nr:hypothetical protein [Nitrososphaerales archaeon]
MRIPLADYLEGAGTKVYSLVASAPFSPLDIDLGLLARGEWDASRDRFRLWYLPKIKGQDDRTLFYATIRKLDQQSEVLVYMHIVPDLELTSEEREGQPSFTVGILSNDDVRARSVLSVILDCPPIFHRRTDVRLIERKWRTDPGAVMRFAANVYSTTRTGEGESGAPVGAKFQLSPDALTELKRHLDSWWEAARGESSEEMSAGADNT